MKTKFQPPGSLRKSAKAGSEWLKTPKLAAAIVAQIARFNPANERNTTTPLRLQPGAPHTAIIRRNVDSCPPPCAAVCERFSRITVLAANAGHPVTPGESAGYWIGHFRRR